MTNLLSNLIEAAKAAESATENTRLIITSRGIRVEAMRGNSHCGRVVSWQEIAQANINVMKANVDMVQKDIRREFDQGFGGDEMTNPAWIEQQFRETPEGQQSTLFANMAKQIAELTAQRDRLIAALTPSGDTKAAYMGEVRDDVTFYDEIGNDHTQDYAVSWTAIKEVMALIRKEVGL